MKWLSDVPIRAVDVIKGDISFPLRAWLSIVRRFSQYITPEYRKVLRGTTAAAEGGSTTVAHGLDSTKIVGYTATVFFAAGQGVSPEYSFQAGYKYSVWHDTVNFNVELATTPGSASIKSKSFVIVVTYTD